MKRARHRARVLAVQALYLREMGDVSVPQAVRTAHGMSNRTSAETDPVELEYAETLLADVTRERARIDQLITQAGANWRLDRMAQLDAQILRVSVAELIARRADVPAAVAIDEAIEIAREFGGERSPAFVNGVLDAVARGLGVKEPPLGASRGDGG